MKIKADIADIDIYPKHDTCAVVGHCELVGQQGAFNPTVGTEFNYNVGIAAELIGSADIFRYDIAPYKSFSKNYTRVIKRNMAPLTKGYKLGLELHFNAHSSEANGVEALYWHTNMVGKAVAEKFCELMHEEFGSYIRGAKPISHKGQRGFAALYYQQPTYLILEPFFCTGSEASNFDEPHEKERYAKVLRELIAWYEINY